MWCLVCHMWNILTWSYVCMLSEGGGERNEREGKRKEERENNFQYWQLGTRIFDSLGMNQYDRLWQTCTCTVKVELLHVFFTSLADFHFIFHFILKFPEKRSYFPRWVCCTAVMYVLYYGRYGRIGCLGFRKSFTVDA